MKNIIIVATGGTIAGSGKVGKATNYQAGKINIKEIIDSIPMINEVANLKAIQLFNVDSNEMNEEHWIILANKINDLEKLLELQNRLEALDNEILSKMEEWEDIENELKTLKNTL